MAEVVAITASVVTLVKASRKVADGISRLADLKNAPEVLLALNNEVEDLSDLERRYKDTLPEAISPSFYRTLHRTEAVLLDVEKLIAYKLTTTVDNGTSLRVDRSAWLRAHGMINQAQQQVRDCRISLSTAINLFNSSMSVDLYSKTRQISRQIDTFASVNAQYHRDLCDRLIGVNTQTYRLADVHDIDNRRGMTALHWATQWTRLDIVRLLIDAGADLHAQDGFGLRNSKQLLDQYNIDKMSTSDLSDVFEEPNLHRIYRLYGNSDAFRLGLATTSASHINQVDVLGETLLFKAIKSDDAQSVWGNRYEAIGCLLDHTLFKWQGEARNPKWPNILQAKLMIGQLHFIAVHADRKTFDILMTVRWITTDVYRFINGLDDQGWTPVRMMSWRRYNNKGWARVNVRAPEDKPVKIFQSFIRLLQKIVDDHYSSDERQDNRRMILDLNPETYLFNLVKETLSTDETQSNPEESASEVYRSDEEEEEIWKDALETWDVTSQALTTEET
ncbi:MAG: hypothetical protein Q9213_008329, partial [Squamulea squamosa]